VSNRNFKLDKLKYAGRIEILFVYLSSPRRNIILRKGSSSSYVEEHPPNGYFHYLFIRFELSDEYISTLKFICVGFSGRITDFVLI